MSQCSVVLQESFGNDSEVQCPHSAIVECSDPNCGDPVCGCHSETCDLCGQAFCDMHFHEHLCGKRQPMLVRGLKKEWIA